MKQFLSYILLSLNVIAWADANACTNYLVTRGASADGSTMVSYAADSHIRYGELYFKPRGIWPAGTMITLTIGNKQAPWANPSGPRNLPGYRVYE